MCAGDQFLATEPDRSPPMRKPIERVVGADRGGQRGLSTVAR